MRKKKAAGFTLVELIVVIAVMGILGAVGTVAYSGYVKSAQKKADMVTVGNIERAIETGVNSYAFSVPELQQLSDAGVEIPVGVIVLTNNEGGIGVQTMESTSTLHSGSEDCEMEKVKVYQCGEPQKVKNGSSGLLWKTYYYKYYYDLQLVGEYEICKTHSNYETTPIAKSQSPDPNATQKNLYFYKVDDGEYQLSNGYKYVNKEKWERANIKLMGHDTLTTYVGSGSGGKFQTTDVGVLSDMLAAAYGSDYANSLRLKYGQWNSAENIDSIPSFYSDAKGSWNQLTNLMDEMFAVTDGNAIYEFTLFGIKLDEIQILGEDYASQQELIRAVAAQISRKNDFVAQWDAATDSTDINYAFGLASGQNREMYGSARKLYNDAFASYVEAHHSAGTAASHAASIRNFGDTGADLVEEKLGRGILGQIGGAVADSLSAAHFPRCANQGAFGNEKYASVPFTTCDECKQLYAEYTAGGANSAAHANGEAIYQMMTSINDTAETAVDNTKTKNDFYNYYNSYLQEFSGMYEAAANAAGDAESSIIIYVYSKDGKLRQVVSPTQADPRS